MAHTSCHFGHCQQWAILIKEDVHFDGRFSRLQCNRSGCCGEGVVWMRSGVLTASIGDVGSDAGQGYAQAEIAGCWGVDRLRVRSREQLYRRAEEPLKSSPPNRSGSYCGGIGLSMPAVAESRRRAEAARLVDDPLLRHVVERCVSVVAGADSVWLATTSWDARVAGVR